MHDVSRVSAEALRIRDRSLAISWGKQVGSFRTRGGALYQARCQGKMGKQGFEKE